MNSVPTFTATIYVGFKNRDTGEVHEMCEVASICRQYCDAVGLCVTITPTHYIYKDGEEPGCAVGLINYPRFPSTPEQITSHALALAQLLKDAMEQYKVSVVFPGETVMLSTEPAA